MNKNTKPPSNRVPTANVLQPQPQQQVTVQTQQYSGQIPPPSLLGDFDKLIPGTAARLIQWAEDEQQHRRRLESESQTANIEAQRRQLDIADYQSKAVFRSDMIGQALGFCVCASCVVGAVILGLRAQTGVAVALAAIPTGAVIYAFRSNIFSSKKQK